jgi:hypothetical protein
MTSPNLQSFSTDSYLPQKPVGQRKVSSHYRGWFPILSHADTGCGDESS